MDNAPDREWGSDGADGADGADDADTWDSPDGPGDTGDTGDTDDTDGPDDLVRSALADARGIARTTPGRRSGQRSGGRRRDRDAARATRADNLAGRDRAAHNPLARNVGGYSAPGPDPTSDPLRLGGIIDGYAAERGWQRPLAEARVLTDWPSLVGAEVAAHCVPHALVDGQLRITAESTAWATQLRLLGSSLLARLVAELGPDVVTTLQISGPSGPSWNRGRWSVRGRGPRDTYG